MFRNSQLRFTPLLSILPLFLVSNIAFSKPWLDPGDIRLRHELELLSDSGLLRAPITAWPLAVKDIEANLYKLKEGESLTPGLKQAYDSVNRRLLEEDFRTGYKLEAKARTEELLIRDFSGEGRDNGSLSYDGEWGSPFLDVRLKVSVADKSSNPSDRTLRLDESYIAKDIGNWKITVGQQSRFWGPAWDTSLILSNNARPIPSVSVENVLSKHDSDSLFFLRWLGHSKVHFFVGQLESQRGVPDARVIGTRITLKPHRSFEIGLFRNIQVEDFSNFSDTVLGFREETDDGGLGSVEGNSLAGLDFRWNLPFGGSNTHYSLYTQYLGEDRVAGSVLLGDEIILAGASVAGVSKRFKGSWRVYIEAADTSAGLIRGVPRNNVAFNNGSFPSGFRFQDVALGANIDSDSRLISGGVIISQANGNLWRVFARHAELNEDGEGQNPIAPDGREYTALGLSLDTTLSNETKVNLGVQLISDRITGESRDNDIAISVGFSKSF